jgi:virulence-associated protein VapD
MISQVALKAIKPQTVEKHLSKVQQLNNTGSERVYAIAFDMDIESLKLNYGDPYNNAYGEIGKFLQKKGFTRQQGSVYFGDPNIINAVTCVLAAIDLSQNFSWFSPSVRDIRMLRIEELNDLMPAVQQNR